jgi:hypothetical protein
MIIFTMFYIYNLYVYIFVPNISSPGAEEISEINKKHFSVGSVRDFKLCNAVSQK